MERDEGRAAALAGTLETLAFPAEWVRQVDRDEAGALAGMPVARGGAYFAQGMLMQPGRLIETLLALPGVTVLPAQVARVHQDGGQWQALDAAGRELARADTMILANAAGARGVLDASGLLEPGCRAWRRCTRWPARSRCCPPRRWRADRVALLAARAICCPIPARAAWPAAPMSTARNRR